MKAVRHRMPKKRPSEVDIYIYINVYIYIYMHVYISVYIYVISTHNSSVVPPLSNHISIFHHTIFHFYPPKKAVSRSSQFQGLPIYRFGSSFWGEAFAGHYTSWRFHAALTACAATAPRWLLKLCISDL